MIRITQQNSAGDAKRYYATADYYSQGQEIVGLLTENPEAGISRRGEIAEPVRGIGPAKIGLYSFLVVHLSMVGTRQVVFQ